MKGTLVFVLLLTESGRTGTPLLAQVLAFAFLDC